MADIDGMPVRLFPQSNGTTIVKVGTGRKHPSLLSFRLDMQDGAPDVETQVRQHEKFVDVRAVHAEQAASVEPSSDPSAGAGAAASSSEGAFDALFGGVESMLADAAAIVAPKRRRSAPMRFDADAAHATSLRTRGTGLRRAKRQRSECQDPECCRVREEHTAQKRKLHTQQSEIRELAMEMDAMANGLEPEAAVALRHLQQAQHMSMAATKRFETNRRIEIEICRVSSR